MFGIFSRIKKLIKVKSQSKYCPTCNTRINHFKPIEDEYWKILDQFQFIHSPFQFETLNWLEYYCENCKSNDRERLIALYFKMNSNLLAFDKNWLEIAPSNSFKQFIQTNHKGTYRTADLMMENVDDKVDIQDMFVYTENMFDLVLCSHVLEHIPDDNKAVKELYRVLKKDGVLVVLVPISLALEDTLENKDYTSVADKWKYYGQNDHLRMYSKNGFKQLLISNGFKLEELDISYFGENSFNSAGLHHRSVLYIAIK